MDIEHISPEYKCLGSITVNPKGQVVIPANARKELGIENGDTLLVFKVLHDQVLALVKVEALEQALKDMSKHVAGFERLMKEYKPRVAGNKEGGPAR